MDRHNRHGMNFDFFEKVDLAEVTNENGEKMRILDPSGAMWCKDIENRILEKEQISTNRIFGISFSACFELLVIVICCLCFTAYRVYKMVNELRYRRDYWDNVREEMHKRANEVQQQAAAQREKDRGLSFRNN